MTFRKLHLELQSVESLLRQGGGFAMNSRLCTDCGRRLPATAKKCHPCYCSTLQDEYCTSQTRIAEYFAVLSKCELWPSLGPFQKCTVLELVERFDCLKEDNQHQCSVKLDCPLARALERLKAKVDRIVKNTRGIALLSKTLKI